MTAAAVSQVCRAARQKEGLVRREAGEGQATLIMEVPLALRRLLTAHDLAPDDPGDEGLRLHRGWQFDADGGAWPQEHEVFDAAPGDAEVNHTDLRGDLCSSTGPTRDGDPCRPASLWEVSHGFPEGEQQDPGRTAAHHTQGLAYRKRPGGLLVSWWPR